MKITILSAFLTLLLLMLGSCDSCQERKETVKEPALEEPGEPAYGDTIVVGSIGDASNLLPPLASDSASFDIIGLVYNGIVKYDKDLKIVGDLAESWDISPDGLEIIFHLRKGVKWHDGVEFTAEDVMFGYRKIIDPNTPTAYASSFEEVKEAEILDKYTFKVTYKEPFAPGLASWGNLVVLPQHLLEGEDITKSPLTRSPVGTGPYRFVEWKTGEKIVLEYNPDYFEGRPHIDRYLYRFIPEQATMFLELKAERIDEMGLTPLQYRRQTNSPDFLQKFNKYRYLSFGYTYLGYNLLEPKFQDIRVRHAISSAINKQDIVDGVLLGLGRVATGPFKPDTIWYNPEVKRYPYDPEKARALLEEAGWVDTDGDGILDKEGEPFSFTIITNQGNEQRKKSAEIIQRNLKEIGIEVKIHIIEWAAFINDFIDKKNFEAVILGWSLDPDPDQYDIWHSRKTKFKEFNFISYKNPEVDDLLVKARHTMDPEERRKYYFRFQEILAEEQPYTFLYVAESLPAIHSRFKGIEPAPAGIGYNFIEWYVPKHLQKYTK
ncbi:MAG: peptide-binding protein [Deltaproteobacteria bacterium]|nr:MAG: peptide-binding protein [Deltaproteobacteria bacterium]